MPPPSKTVMQTALNSRVLRILHQNSKDLGFHPGSADKHFSEPQFPQVQRERVKFIRSFKPQQTLNLLLFSFLPVAGGRAVKKLQEINLIQ